MLSNSSLEVVSDWNRHEPKAAECCLHDIIQQRCRTQPDRPAVSAWDGNISYRELDELSSRLAIQLQAAGVAPETSVPICFSRCKWVAVAVLAVAKAGGAFTLLDPSHPLDRLKDICQSLGARITLATSDHAQQAGELTQSTLVIEDQFRLAINPQHISPRADVLPTQAAYIIFTSGSTGKPKGVVIEHRNICSALFACTEPLHIQHVDRVLHFSSYAFDASVVELLASLAAGACICIPSEDDRKNNLPHAIAAAQATWALLTPTVARVLEPHQVPSLRTLVLGGEAMLKSDMEKWAPHLNLLCAYGPAECTPIVLTTPPLSLNSDPISLGRSFSSVASWIVDIHDSNRLAPIGVVGELVIEGPQVSRGYMHELSGGRPKESPFIISPPWLSLFRQNAHSRRLYKTGDLVQYGSGGEIRYIGRKDSQVKIRGQRLELGEIEYHLQRAAHSSRAVLVDAVPLKQAANRAVLLAFLLQDAPDNEEEGMVIETPVLGDINQEFHAYTADIASKMSNVLPSYMVPTVFLPLYRIPLSKSGKADRKQLRQVAAGLPLDFLNGMLSTTGQLPSTKMEEALQTLFAQVLRLPADRIWADSHFFRLGGDSVGAMQLVSAARERQIGLSVALVFQHSKLSDLALVASTSISQPATAVPTPFSLLKSNEKDEAVAAALEQCRVSIGDVEDIYPCTPLQEGLMALTAQDPSAYVAQFAYTLPKTMNVDRLREAWNKTALAHAILRTRIIQTPSGNTYQVVVKAPPPWEEHEADGTFDYSKSQAPAGLGKPLLRLSLIRSRELSTADSMALSVHHALYDAWSLSLLMSELERAYQGLPLRSQPFTPFVSFICESHSAAAKFWAQDLEDVEAVQFPAVPSADYTPEPQSTMSTAIPCSAQDISKDDITVATRVRFAWALLVSHYTNTNDIVFGETTSGRGAPVTGIDRMVAPTIATSPTRIIIDPAQSVTEALHEVQRHAIKCSSHEHIGLQNISQQSDSCAAGCKFQTLLSVQPVQAESRSLFQDHQVISDITRFLSYPLVIICELSGEGMDLKALFDSRVVQNKDMQRILRQFEHVFSQLCNASDELPISALDTVNPEDWRELQMWNPEPPIIPSDAHLRVHGIIQQQCQAHPIAPAVSAWDGGFSYEELDAYAEIFAQQLRNHNVGPETYVPIYFEKSRWSVVAQLAVMKSGGAFCMLDPAHPPSRLREICDDLAPPLLITSAEMQASAINLGLPILIVSHEQSRVSTCAGCGNHAEPTVIARNPLYVVFTSGSTGRPKGVVIEHRSMYASAMAHIQILGLNRHSRVFQFSSYGFDASILEHISTLLAGGCVCIPSEFDRRNNIAKAVAELRANWALLTPSVIRAFSPDDLPTIERLASGGEAMSQDIIDRWSSRTHLMNLYGPSECSIVCCICTSVDGGTSPRNIGYGSGGICWILDPDDPEKLLPIGAVGELVIEGPIVGRGYLNNPEKTTASFIERPRWLTSLRGKQGTSERLYRTGDLVKYDLSGAILYMGRKDGQVKLRGQRIELMDVEHHVRQCFPGAQNILADVVKPADGKRDVLVAFICSDQFKPDNEVGKCPNILAPATQPFLESVRNAEASLAGLLPTYMIPNMFFPVFETPLTKSGKVDRRCLCELAKSLSRHDWEKYTPAQKAAPENETEETLQHIWARVLTMVPDEIGIHDSFFHIGGDSITSMQVSSHCNSAGMSVTSADISKYKTISQLVAHCGRTACPPSSIANVDEGIGTWNELSPIQQMFFDLVPDGQSHFNQSFLLRLGHKVDVAHVSQALSALVETHSMLRSRFRKEDGRWTQRVMESAQGSYQFTAQSVNLDDIQQICTARQKSIDFQNGPLLVVDLFNDANSETQYLYLVAHHLVIDLVSWRIIFGDLEELLLRPGNPLASAPPTPFMTWCKLQLEYAAHQLPPTKALPGTIPDITMPSESYWGPKSCNENTFGNVDKRSFTIDQETTHKILGAANNAFGTQPVEVMLAALLHAFTIVFPDRSTPTVFTEGHGREPWDHGIDLTRTVGWFTSMYPITISLQSQQRLIEALRLTKDARRRVPANGWAYFTSRYLNPQGRQTFAQRGPMEILFNYLGLYQQLEGPNAFLKWDQSLPTAADVTDEMPRFALIDVSSFVMDNRLHFWFYINRHMNHLEALDRWVKQYEISLREAAAILPTLDSAYTLSDFPLSSLTSEKFDEFLRCNQLQYGDLEDIYPCSPLQEGILVSQAKNPDQYWTRYIWDVVPEKAQQGIDTDRLARAWQQVVNRHATLRTVFAPLSADGSVDQVVLKYVMAAIKIETRVENHPSESGITALGRTTLGRPQPPHELLIRRIGDDRVQCELLINHALIDAASMQILKRDLILAYDKELSTEHAPSYREYIAYLQGKDLEADQDYWHERMKGATPCLFPGLNDDMVTSEDATAIDSVQLDIAPHSSLQSFCQKHGIAITNLVHVVWALVLRQYLGTDSTCFGYVTSGRHVPVPEVNDTVGPFINMLVSRIKVPEDASILSILLSNQEDFATSLSHQHHSLAKTKHSANDPLFNSVVSLQIGSLTDQKPMSSSITTENSTGDDPTEVSFSYPVLN